MLLTSLISFCTKQVNLLSDVQHGQYIDPLGQPEITAGRDHCFRTCCPSIRPSPLFKSSKSKQKKTMVATGVSVSLAEWIIDDTCLVSHCFPQISFVRFTA